MKLGKKNELETNKAVNTRPIEFTLNAPLFTFDDIILEPSVLDEIEKTIAQLQYAKQIYEDWGMGKVLKRKRNISVNLYGKSGTGKTMAAHAIAGKLNRQILLVNYAEIESKYVGDTSKNLVRMFEFARERNAVVVFDEADALLSRRVTAMQSSADVSVNQTRNVLLRILDEYEGVILFTTNFIRNYDNAFLRRITAHIHLEMPNKEIRKRLWEHYLPESLPYDGNKRLSAEELSTIEGVTGADIANAVLKAAVAAAVGQKKVDIQLLKKELMKLDELQKIMDDSFPDDVTVTSRKVSKDYVKEQIEEGGLIHRWDS